MLKEKLAREALKYVQSGMVVGLGSGTTAREFIKALAGLKLDLTLVATSIDSELTAFEVGLGDRLRPMWAVDEIDLAVDGADEVTREGVLLKGRGGALTREKIVDYTAGRLVVLVEEEKVVDKIPKRNPIPVEVLPWAWRHVAREIVKTHGGSIRLRMGEGRVGPVVTDNGNFIIDWTPSGDVEPARLEDWLKSTPGVVDCGIFSKRRDAVILVARSGGEVYQLSRDS